MAQEYVKSQTVSNPELLEHPLDIYVKMEVDSDAEAEVKENLPLMTDQDGSINPIDELNISLDSNDAMPHPDSSLYRCLHCLKDMEKENLQEHMVKVHEYKNIHYKCHMCLKKFKEISVLYQHRKTAHGPPLATCEICLIQVGKKYLNRHIQNVHYVTQALETCDYCKKCFKSKETLKDHIKTVHIESELPELHVCEQCSQEFKSKKYLGNHIRNVHPKGDKVFKCPACFKDFKSKICLTQHVKNVHPPETASAPCKLCDKVFKSKANLSQHMKHVHP